MLKNSIFYNKIQEKEHQKQKKSNKTKCNVEMNDRKLRYEAKMEGKLISQAAKQFNIHLHSQNLFKEGSGYLGKFLSLKNR